MSAKAIQQGHNTSNIKEIIENIATKSREVAELFELSPQLRERVHAMITSFPTLPNNIEAIILYYIRVLEYFETYEIDQFDPCLDRVEQKIERLKGELNLNYNIHQNVQLKARQVLAYS